MDLRVLQAKMTNRSRLKYSSFAKINVRLDVLDRLPSGYHSVRIISLLIDLHDVIEIARLSKGGIKLRIPQNHSLENDNNLIVKAAKMMAREYNIRINLDILLNKMIPIEAGLGGGSSNAALIIKAINELYELGEPPQNLIKLGCKIGSDVPFFLVGRNALITGTGEKIEVIPDFPRINLLIIKPDFGIKTSWAYQNLDLTRKNNNDRSLRLKINSLQDVFGILNNDLERVCCKKYPLINKIKEDLVARGASASMMSGSGSSVFGIFESETILDMAYNHLRAKYPFVWKGKTL